MKRKIIKISIVLFVFLSIGSIGKTLVSHAEQSESVAVKKGGIHNLVPLPQEITTNDGKLQMTEQINIVGQEVADEDALRILNEFLQKNGIVVNERFNENSTTIAIGQEGNLSSKAEELERELGIADISNTKAEGYTLEIQSEANVVSSGGTIFLKGKDGDGTFYSVKTLIQLMNKENNLLTFKNVHITDEPSMRVRGIIEGFYGNPWSHEDRLDQIDFYGDQKMNTYIYAPKDDPYHREKWREPYPESEMKRMEDLIGTAKRNKVDFVFAISPGIDIHFDGEQGEKDFQALLEKSESLYNMGVRNFAILFDDIANRDGEKQAKLLNRFNEEFIKTKSDVKPLITVPTEYNTLAMGVIGDLSPYTKAFSDTLDAGIKVMWTGQVVVSDALPLENVEFMQEVYGEHIGVWWNYPVTDYLKSKLALGPIVNIDKRLEGELDFFTMNPMEHANLSKISLATGADYSWNVTEYDSNRSWNRSIENLYGELAPAMKTFANHSSRMTGSWSIGREDAPEVRETMNELWAKLSKRQDATKEIRLLKEEFSDMVKAADTLKESLPQDILDESLANLNKLKLLGENDQLALEMVLAKVKKEDDHYQELYNEIEANLPDLKNGARVSEETALAFIEEAMEFDPMPVVSFDVSKTLVAPGEEVHFTNTSSLTAEKLEWTFKGANVEHSTEQNPKVVYEEEGIYTVKLVGKNPLGEDEVIKEGLITVTHLAESKTMNLALNKETTASSYCADTEVSSFAVDGSTRTKWCGNGGEPHTLTVDLGSVNLVSEIVLQHAEAGGEPVGSNTLAYRVLISEDGENFKELVKVTDNKSGITKDQVPVTKGRYVRLIVDEPTQGDDNAARIYEFEVNGLKGDVELPPTYDPEKPQPTESAAELRELIEKLTDDGAIDAKVAHTLAVRLKVVSHFEDKQSAEKVVKHLEGFKRFLLNQKKHDKINQEVYNRLNGNAEYLIEKWK
ncbi:beta-N-acetylglucosaminidase domain-containing protein [Virgibacillus halodenitrificans]|uniref:beta-N-acetylglucosaminidase domain-containing protein n=1 Tax=Virgibacillus halodenitrificans TaxID=1482 RepID=UPI001F346F5A|nr:beta-N-acetylglucosaminidase domain-containing protein [Virgibacillus halodenitrificans]MCG1027094.1 beta-N-acetylglucosaminidase domain-containing protein [Virgibacillus halodenitrificans]